eukprot:10586761-Lingulodinium_polyedra.AAC.1
MKAKAGEIESILWQRRCIFQLIREYPNMFEVAESAATARDKVEKVQALIESPLAMYELQDSADRDLTFSASLPNEPLRSFSKRLHDVLTGFYAPEVKGALNASPAG